MKIVIVHDELLRRGGAEQVVRCMHLAFPESEIYTMAYNEDLTYPYFKNVPIITSWFQKLAKNEKNLKRLFFPFGILAMKQLSVPKDVNVVLISTTHAGKYINVPKNATVITYCYTPFRLAWNPQSYAEYLNSKGLKRVLFDFVVAIIRKIDEKASKRTDYFIAMTEETKERIRLAYNPSKPIDIIKPAVQCSNFYIQEGSKDYYLIVSRLEYYKKVDLVVNVFNELGFPLIVVGNGSKKEEIKAIAKPNIEFKQGLSSNEIAELYANCKAFIFPQHEDYGITPLEANASGRPVIAYEKGGVLDTMIPFNGNASTSTALFFKEQTIQSLKAAVLKFETLEFNSNFIRSHAEKFDEALFIEKLKNNVLEKYEQSKV